MFDLMRRKISTDHSIHFEWRKSVHTNDAESLKVSIYNIATLGVSFSLDKKR